MSLISSSDKFSPTSIAIFLKFLKLILPVLSSSKSLNTLNISSFESLFGRIGPTILINSSKVKLYEISFGISLKYLITSIFLIGNPRALIAALNSLESIEPEWSVSKS